MPGFIGVDDIEALQANHTFTLVTLVVISGESSPALSSRTIDHVALSNVPHATSNPKPNYRRWKSIRAGLNQQVHPAYVAKNAAGGSSGRRNVFALIIGGFILPAQWYALDQITISALIDAATNGAHLRAPGCGQRSRR